MLVAIIMTTKIGFERNFSPSVGQVPDLPNPEHSLNPHQFFQHFGLCFAFFVCDTLCTFRHFSSLLCTFRARLFRAALFQTHCTYCHGARGQGSRGSDLTTGQYKYGGSDASLYATIRNGLRGTEMPAVLATDDEVWKMVAFVKRLGMLAPGEKAPAMRTRGSSFSKASVPCNWP
jgi:hypothetical protein